ncbi:MAG: hypothetical protein SO170_09040 [Butyribacter sp.]|nr:hypothetical protein [bacterium]MDY3855080.1 hypothetical protein [Butyribacter sp.]
MQHILYNADRPVLVFDFEDMYLEVLDDTFLPFALRSRISTSNFTSRQTVQKSLRDIDAIKDFLSGRVLSFSRRNAKTILDVAMFPQHLSTNSRVSIALACCSLSMTDNFWTAKEGENLCFADVNLRRNKLSDASYPIAILGKHISATREELRSDIMGQGMFPKFWYRNNDKVELWKTDKMSDFSNTKAEIIVSDILDTTDIPHVRYHKKIRDDIVFAVSECFVTDDVSFVTAFDVTTYFGEDAVRAANVTDFANMCVLDYIFANMDRHAGNWGFLVDNKKNCIQSMAPLFDHNQALIADEFETDINDLLYEPTGSTFLETIKKFAFTANVDIDKSLLPEKCRARYDVYLKCKDGL